VDENAFDALVARLAAARSRREALTRIVGGALASISITAVGDAKRRKRRDAAAKKKKKQRGGDGGADGGDRDGRHGARARRHRRERHRARSRHDAQADKKKKKRKKRDRDRCKKNGTPCAKDSKCCSKHCSPVTGTCARRPDS
jgi:hypothetical protein